MTWWVGLPPLSYNPANFDSHKSCERADVISPTALEISHWSRDQKSSDYNDGAYHLT